MLQLVSSSRSKKARKSEPVRDNSFTMKRVSPLTPAQSHFFEAWRSGKNICAVGSAGTGKTYCALGLALADVLERETHESVTVIRSAVQVRDLGFTPGKVDEKEAAYELPYVEIAEDLFERKGAWGILKHKGQARFASTSFLRGLSLKRSIIIADEFSSMSFHELDTIVTRIGEGSRLIFCGDTAQSDLIKSKYDVSGFAPFMTVMERMSSVEIVRFGREDVIRSGLVREYLEAKEAA